MGHVVLLGDSIFDNARYVPDKPPVIEQVRRSLPSGWQASLLARDGDIASDVLDQLNGLPLDATHLFVSAGGNNALGEITVLSEPSATVGEALHLLRELQTQFREEYHGMLKKVCEPGNPVTVCTIYDSIPDMGPPELAALALFNDIILREAFQGGFPVIDLRLVCNRQSDYSPLSSIEPSVIGGLKIARLIAEVATKHDFERGQTMIYS